LTPRRPAPYGEPNDVDTKERRARFRVALVSMPFAPQTMPSIQIGLLAAIGRGAGFPVDTYHLGLELAARIGTRHYEEIAGHGGEIANWTFSVAAFGPEAPDREGLLLGDLVASHPGFAKDETAACTRLRHLRDDIVDAYLDEMLQAVDWGRYAVVGFTLTYQQKTASFALARRIKERWPHVRTLFGGANFDEPMGEAWMRGVTSIDLGVNGEADVAFPELLGALADGRTPAGIPGVIWRRAGEVIAEPSHRAVDDISWLPVPDYDEFFGRAERLGLLPEAATRKVQLPFQAARGCWWGEKTHCTFCGIADATLRYRVRSPESVAAELTSLAQRYRTFRFLNTDLILDLGHLEELLGRFAREDFGFSFWWEIKANLTRDQVRALRAGGLRTVQPGIEALHSEPLRLMRKGSRMVTNLNLLRWCAYYGIDVKWNRIVGFPGETEEAIAAEAALLPWLWHLTPPGNAGGISLDRYSPLFEDAERFPRQNLRPAPGFYAVYPPYIDAYHAAFSFEAELEHTLDPRAYGPLFDALRAWGVAAGDRPRPTLTASWAPGVMHVEDRRIRGQWHTHVLQGAAASVLRACFDGPRPATAVCDELRGSPEGLDAQTVDGAIDELKVRRLLVQDGALLLALPVPATPYR
jgi:ribosomal peptide maturation radical SAM protein 1